MSGRINAAQDIIVKPIITEKTMSGMPDKRYTFKVAKNAGKIEIVRAVEELFKDVKVDKVRTLSVKGKFRRQGKYSGYTPSWKKAYVTLKSDSKAIEFFENLV